MVNRSSVFRILFQTMNVKSVKDALELLFFARLTKCVIHQLQELNLKTDFVSNNNNLKPIKVNGTPIDYQPRQQSYLQEKSE